MNKDLFNFVSLVTLLGFGGWSTLSDTILLNPPWECPAFAPSTCFGENQTCCPSVYSGSGYGCCLLPNAVCCSNNQTCCPQGTTCPSKSDFEAPDGDLLSNCTDNAGNQLRQNPLCKPGPALDFSTEMPNCVILGDSISIGYTPFVAAWMTNDTVQHKCAVQHSPWDTTDGGAEDTGYGFDCLQHMLSSPKLVELKPDVIQFNFGLHNTAPPGKAKPGQSGYPQDYAPQLTLIADELLKTGAKLLFVLSTPVPYSVEENDIIVELNQQAVSIMTERSIPILDLYSAVIDVCGQVPFWNCSISLNRDDDHNLHYTQEGYSYFSSAFIVPSLQKIMSDLNGK